MKAKELISVLKSGLGSLDFAFEDKNGVRKRLCEIKASDYIKLLEKEITFVGVWLPFTIGVNAEFDDTWGVK